jgi:hypothetical protein
LAVIGVTDAANTARNLSHPLSFVVSAWRMARLLPPRGAYWSLLPVHPSSRSTAWLTFPFVCCNARRFAAVSVKPISFNFVSWFANLSVGEA